MARGLLIELNDDTDWVVRSKKPLLRVHSIRSSLIRCPDVYLLTIRKFTCATQSSGGFRPGMPGRRAVLPREMAGSWLVVGPDWDKPNGSLCRETMPPEKLDFIGCPCLSVGSLKKLDEAL